MDMKTIKTIENATEKTLSSFAKLSLSLLFLLAVFLWTYSSHGKVPDNTFLIIGAIFGAYMALNIGANDVANNVGPAVGARALTLTGAIIIAAIFESAGAIIAGGDVVNTIKSGIIDPSLIADKNSFIWAMTAGLLAGAVWLNFATSIGAPVSTTHAIVGGVMGAGIASAGFSILNWGSLAEIASSWVISPLLGGIVAAGFLYFIKKQIVYKENMLEQAQKFVPYLIAVIDKNLSNLSNDRSSVNKLFTPALIFGAALLSFAHGANDVSNAIGPLAAINDAIVNGGGSINATVPLWIMVVGAIRIVIGLVLYGPRLIKTVGSEITELDQMRAFSVAMATAVTVIVASQMGLPVSSTHIAIGGVFGVGFLREALDMTEKNHFQDIREKFKKHKKELENLQKDLVKLEAIKDKSKAIYIKIVETFKAIDEIEAQVKQEKKDFKDAKGAKYVKRDAVKKIVAAWVITVPASALLAAGIYYMIKGIVAI